MNLAITVCMVAVVILALRAVGLKLLPAEELEKLEAVKCPVCKTNLQTITLICVLMKGIASFVRRVVRHTGHRTTEKVGGRPKTFHVNH